MDLEALHAKLFGLRVYLFETTLTGKSPMCMDELAAAASVLAMSLNVTVLKNTVNFHPRSFATQAIVAHARQPIAP